MIMVILNWLYIAITSFVTGFAVLSFFSGIFKTEQRKVLPCVWAGLAVNTVYAQIWSLFGGVKTAANIVLITATAVLIVLMREKMGNCLVKAKSDIASVRGLRYVYATVLILMAYGTSRGIIHYDTSLYHAQSIHWIEEYGVVKGLACLQLRFGYNSSAFALTALYSFKSVTGQSLHTTAGFFALLGAIHVVDIYKIFADKRVRTSDFIRLGLLFYLGLIFREMVSPASDYYAQILIFAVLIMWLEALEEESTEYSYAMLSILLVYAATVKFSIALLVLLAIKPAVMMIRKKQIKQIVFSLAGGIIVLVPFLIRNVIISGWLIYPSTIIDLFDFDWKIPKGLAQYDAMEIGVYGKGINDVTLYNMPMKNWLPSWFAGMSIIEKGWVLLTAVSIIIGTAYFIYKLIKRKADYDRLLIWCVMVAGSVFWFMTAPLVRYGYGYLTCVPLLTDSFLCMEMVEKSRDRRSLYIAYIAVLVVISLYRVKTVGYDILATIREPYYLEQKDYIDWPAERYELDGHTIYVPKQDALIGYNLFPASLLSIDVQMRGDSFEDGFRFRDYQAFLDSYENDN